MVNIKIPSIMCVTVGCPENQLVAVTVAKSIDKTLDFVAKTLSLADLPMGAATVVNKIINYAKHFAADVVEIETVK